jgi:PAS domain S-box-containing protein
VIGDSLSKPTAFVIITKDITERKKTEDALKESEERFRTIFENATDGILLADPESKKFSDSNKTLCRMLGYTCEEMKNLGVMDIHPDEDLLWVIEEFESQLKGEKTLARNIPVKRKDGSVFFADVNSAPININSKQYMMGIFRDVTERKKVEARMNLLNDAVRMSTDSIVITDLNGTILDVNKASLRLYGSEDKNDLIGKNSLELIVPEERPGALRSQTENLNTGHVRETEYHVITKSCDKILVEMSSAVMKDALGRPIGFVTVSRDITKRKKMEGELRNTLQELREKNKELDEFVYVASHDLKAPLVTIQGFADLLKKKYKDRLEPGAEHYVDNIISGAENLRKLVHDLLALSRAGRIKPMVAQVELTNVIRSSLESLMAIKDERKAEISVPEELPVVQYDPTHLEEVFTNLLSNAIMYSKPDSSSKIEIGWKETKEEFFIWIRDNGRGIEEQNWNKIFKPFERIAKDQKGTGIGLSIVKKIVERHGGRIWVESEFGEGSAFYFTIPKEVKV